MFANTVSFLVLLQGFLLRVGDGHRKTAATPLALGSLTAGPAEAVELITGTKPPEGLKANFSFTRPTKANMIEFAVQGCKYPVVTRNHAAFVWGHGGMMEAELHSRRGLPLQEVKVVNIDCHMCKEGWVLRGGPPSFATGFPKFAYATSSANAFEQMDITVVHHCAKFADTVGKKVIFMRHGQSVWNGITETYGLSAQIVGTSKSYTDSPLSDIGLKQALRTAQILEKIAAASEDPMPEVEDGDIIRRGAQRAMHEMKFVNLERYIEISNSTSKTLRDTDLARGLASHPFELDILLGRFCNETEFVGSSLIRGIDTLNIALLPARARHCSKSFRISSNLQEFEHNADCQPRTKEGENPVFDDQQRDNYIAAQMEYTMAHMKNLYKMCDPSRHTRTLTSSERNRFPGLVRDNHALHRTLILDELRATHENKKNKYFVWGGHSIWVRKLLSEFSDQADTTCHLMSTEKIANGGMVSFTLRKVIDEDSPYVVVGCKVIYLGPDAAFKYKVHPEEPTTRLPIPSDFGHGAKEIHGWKCCCPWKKVTGSSGDDMVDEVVKFLGDKGSLSMGLKDSVGVCLMVRAGPAQHLKCGSPEQWQEISNAGPLVFEAVKSYKWSAAWGFVDDPSRTWCDTGIDPRVLVATTLQKGRPLPESRWQGG